MTQATKLLKWKNFLFFNHWFFYNAQNLKDALEKIIPEKQKEVAEFRKQYGSAKVGEVTVDMVSI